MVKTTVWKTQEMVRSRESPTHYTPLRIYRTLVEKVNNFRYLGDHISEDLTWTWLISPQVAEEIQDLHSAASFSVEEKHILGIYFFLLIFFYYGYNITLLLFQLLHGHVPSYVPVCPQIHLCCGNHSLGSTDVSLSALAAVSVDLESKAATVEGAFVLQPPKRIKKTLPTLPADLQPTVGVAVTLRREEVTPQVYTPRKCFGLTQNKYLRVQL